VLRLPVTFARSLICFASRVHAAFLCSCLAAVCAPGRPKGAFQAGVIVQPATRLPVYFHMDVSGISQVSRQSVLCLCPGLRPRPNQIPRLFDGFVDAAPTLPTVRASAVNEFRGSIARLRHLLLTLQEWCCHHPCKARFRLAGSPLPGGS